MKVTCNFEFDSMAECSNFLLSAGCLMNNSMINVKPIVREVTPEKAEEAATKAPEKEVTAEAPEPTPDKEEIKAEDVRAELNELAKQNGKEAVKAIFEEFGAKNFTQVKAKDYEAVLEAAKKALNG